MAEQSSAQAEVALKKALHWIIEEVDRLAVVWCKVSTEKGGVGANQRIDGMWRKITYKYHNDLPPPPTPRDSLGNECLPRNENALTSKWKRTRPLIAKYMKCHMLALSHPLSGENAEGVLLRTMIAYRRTEAQDFAFISVYNIVREEPKWHLDVAQLENSISQQTGAAKQTVIELLERETEREPTVVGTRKPEGQKKARRTMAEMSGKDKEIAKEEAELSAYLDAISQRSKISLSALAKGNDRTRAIQCASDDKIMFMDTTGMDDRTRGYYELRRKHAEEHIQLVEAQKEEERNIGAEALLAAEAAIAAEETGTQTADDRSTEEEGEGEEPELSDKDGEGFNGSEEEFDARVRNEE